MLYCAAKKLSERFSWSGPPASGMARTSHGAIITLLCLIVASNVSGQAERLLDEFASSDQRASSAISRELWIARFERILADDSDSSDPFYYAALNRLASLHISNNNPGDAAAIYRRLLDSDDPRLDISVKMAAAQNGINASIAAGYTQEQRDFFINGLESSVNSARSNGLEYSEAFDVAYNAIDFSRYRGSRADVQRAIAADSPPSIVQRELLNARSNISSYRDKIRSLGQDEKRELDRLDIGAEVASLEEAGVHFEIGRVASMAGEKDAATQARRDGFLTLLKQVEEFPKGRFSESSSIEAIAGVDEFDPSSDYVGKLSAVVTELPANQMVAAQLILSASGLVNRSEYHPAAEELFQLAGSQLDKIESEGVDRPDFKIQLLLGLGELAIWRGDAVEAVKARGSLADLRSVPDSYVPAIEKFEERVAQKFGLSVDSLGAQIQQIGEGDSSEPSAGTEASESHVSADLSTIGGTAHFETKPYGETSLPIGSLGWGAVITCLVALCALIASFFAIKISLGRRLDDEQA